MKKYYVYILANKKNGTLYVGMTKSLARRINEHKTNFIISFTSKYSVHKLVYYEGFSDVNDAILREKQLKKWKRAWKIDLIEKDNPGWLDLYDQVLEL